MSNFIELLHDANAIGRQKAIWKRFIDGTPLSNDIAVWMAEFALDKSADHDRIVAGLREERDQLAERCRELDAQVDGIAGDGALAEERCCGLLSENAALRSEVERLATVIEDNAEAVTLRAEVERLKIRLAWAEPCEPNHEDVKRLVSALSYLGVSTPESMEEAAIRWLSLVRTLIRNASDSKLLRYDSEKLAEVERLRKDAERLTWLIDEEARIHGYLAQHGLRFGLVWPNGDQQADLFACPREAIDAALEASR